MWADNPRRAMPPGCDMAPRERVRGRERLPGRDRVWKESAPDRVRRPARDRDLMAWLHGRVPKALNLERG
jgi:hypothetical protein